MGGKKNGKRRSFYSTYQWRWLVFRLREEEKKRSFLTHTKNIYIYIYIYICIFFLLFLLVPQSPYFVAFSKQSFAYVPVWVLSCSLLHKERKEKKKRSRIGYENVTCSLLRVSGAFIDIVVWVCVPVFFFFFSCSFFWFVWTYVTGSCEKRGREKRDSLIIINIVFFFFIESSVWPIFFFLKPCCCCSTFFFFFYSFLSLFFVFVFLLSTSQPTQGWDA